MMLLFRPHHIPMIRDGRKTESRRMWEKARVSEGSYQQVKKLIFTKEHFGYIQIRKLYRQHLLDITEESAQREGGYMRAEYLRAFHEIYPGVGENPELWVLEFEYIGMEKVK